MLEESAVCKTMLQTEYGIYETVAGVWEIIGIREVSF